MQILDHFYKQEGYSTGLGLPGLVENTNVQYFVSPVIDYFGNINGGNPDKPLELGTLSFEGDRDLILKKGIVAGISAGANGRHIYDQGKYLDFSLDASFLRSISYDLWVTQSSFSVCSKNHMFEYWYLDACTTSARTKKHLTDSTSNVTSFGFSRLLSSYGNSYHEVSTGVARRFEKSYTQNQLFWALDTIHSNGIFSGASITLGEPLEETLSTKFKIDAKIGTTLFDRSAALSLSYSQAENGKILDFDLQEDTKAIGINYVLTPYVTLNLGYSYTDSNVDFFDKMERSIGVNFSPIRF